MFGRTLVENISKGGFRGAVELVDAGAGVVSGRGSVGSLGELEVVPDLVILAVEGDAVLAFAAEAAAMGRGRCSSSRPAHSRTSRRHQGLKTGF